MARIGEPAAALLALLLAAGPVAAQPFGFLFDDGRDFGAPSRGAASRGGPSRGASSRGEQGVPRRGAQAGARQAPIAPQATAEVPLPEPRPHFPGDPPRREVASEQAEAKPEAATPEAPKPAAEAKPAETKPADANPAAEAKPGETKSLETKPEATGPAAGAPGAPLPAPKPPEIAGKPAGPAVAPSGVTTAESPRQPAAEPGCLARLAGEGVEAEPVTLPPQPDARCTVAEPVRLAGTALPDGGRVAFPDRPTLSCTTAATFAAYVRELLAPLAKGTFAGGAARSGAGAPVAAAGAAASAAASAASPSSLVAVWTGPGLECRSRDHVFGAKLSAHGQGLAVDIAELKLGDGRVVAVGLAAPGDEATRRFETAARAGACGYFHTVLGPGSDSYHRTHWHFDLEVRGREGDGKFCH